MIDIKNELNSNQQINAYTKIIYNCLQQLPEHNGLPKLDDQTVYLLANMIQGRFLEYLIVRILEYYDIIQQKDEFSQNLMRVIINIMGETFCYRFRKKIKENPSILHQIAKKIIFNEISYIYSSSRKTDALFLWLCKKYFDFENIELLIRYLQTYPEIQKVILNARLKQQLQEDAYTLFVTKILKKDEENLLPIIFNRYLNKNKIERLTDLIKTGEWQIELEYLKKKLNTY